jgi:DNA polymerase V
VLLIYEAILTVTPIGGTILIRIGDAVVSQGSLFIEHGAGEKSDRLMEALDRLNQRYGRNTVAIASAGTSRSWKMRRECMSPCYTTSWSDVPVAQAR